MVLNHAIQSRGNGGNGENKSEADSRVRLQWLAKLLVSSFFFLLSPLSFLFVIQATFSKINRREFVEQIIADRRLQIKFQMNLSIYYYENFLTPYLFPIRP